MNYYLKQEKFTKFYFSKEFYLEKNIINKASSMLLEGVLSQTTKKYNTISKYSNKKLDLYNLEFSIRVVNYINYDALRVTFILLDPSLVNDISYNYSEIKEFMFESLYNQTIQKENFEIEKATLITKIEEAFKEPDGQSFYLTNNEYFKNTPFQVYDHSIINEIKEIKLSDLVNFYDKFINSPFVNNFSYSSLPENAINNLLGSSKKSPTLEYKYSVSRDKNILNYNITSKTSYVTVFYNTNVFYNENNTLLQSFFIYLLGQSSNSILFRNIREKHGICYHISAKSLLSSGNIKIFALISKEHEKQFFELLNKEIFNLQSNTLETSYLEDIKNGFIEQLASQEDSYYYNIIKNNRQVFYKPISYETEVSYIKNISLDDIKEFAKKLVKPYIVNVWGDNNE